MSEDPRCTIVFVSDCHYGVPSRDVDEMADAFRKTIFPLLDTANVLFINGDFFDRLVEFDRHIFDPIYALVLELFQICEQKRLALRVMQGTFDHDRNQLKRFDAFYQGGKFTFDYQFHFHISVDTVPYPGGVLKIGYIPDNTPYLTAEENVAVLREKMAERGWDTLDYGCVHGFFEFTFPQNIKQGSQIVYKTKQFDFVEKMVDAGHVHQYRVCDHVVSNGSFDRAVFGDEDAKGCILVKDYPSKYVAQFVVNQYAGLLDTLAIASDAETDAIVKQIDSHVASRQPYVSLGLRFVVERSDQYDAISTYMKQAYPEIKIARKKLDGKEDSQIFTIPSDLVTEEMSERIAPTPQNIVQLILDHIAPEHRPSEHAIYTHLDLTPPESVTAMSG